VASTLFTLARWPIVIALILFAMAFLYWATPNVDLPFQWITPGAVVFTIGWLVASYLFGLYVANFGSYNATYGALGGIVVLLVWFYISAFILLLGGEINALVAQEVAPEKLPQTPAEGATPETVPPHRKAEAAAANVRAAQSVPGRPQAAAASPQPGPARVLDAPVAPASSRFVTLVGVLVAALTFWRLSRPHPGRA
jgi:membrane protein